MVDGPTLDKALALFNEGRIAEALTTSEAAVGSRPDWAEAQNLRALALMLLGRDQEAVEAFGQVVALQPEAAGAWANAGVALHRLQRFEEAVEHFNTALAIAPEDARALNNRAAALMGMRRYVEAETDCARARLIAPDYVTAICNHSDVLNRVVRFADALEAADLAIALQPDLAEPYRHRAAALNGLSRGGEALESCNHALALAPDNPEALAQRALVLHSLGRHEEAIADNDAALVLNPDYKSPWHNKAVTLRLLGRHREAMEAFQKASELGARQAVTLCGAYDCATRICDWETADAMARRLVAEGLETKLPPMTAMRFRDDPTLHLACAKHALTMEVAPTSRRSGRPARSGGDRIRVAYVSADFRAHPVGHLMGQVAARHDKSRFETHAVSLAPDDGSDIRRRLETQFDHFHHVHSLSDQHAARMLGELEIDIAVDLSGHTIGARPNLLAMGLGAVQASYMGFPGSTGADFIDYVLADGQALPFEDQTYYSERIVHLPDCYLPMDVDPSRAGNTPSRAEVGLPKTGFVFCSFNAAWKFTPEMFDLWMRLLGKVEGSVLWLSAYNPDAEAHLRQEAARRNVDPHRLVFKQRTAFEAHLASHALADLFLDTLPYNAHSTGLEALAMGLPLLTCRGATFAGRVGSSLLHAADLPELITDSLDAYEAEALRLATDEGRSAKVRRRLLQNRKTAPLFDAGRHVRGLETAYVQMWRACQAGRPPTSFTVTLP